MADKNTPDLFDDFDLDSAPDSDIDLDAFLKDLNLELSSDEKENLGFLAMPEEPAEPESIPAPKPKAAPRRAESPAPRRSTKQEEAPLPPNSFLDAVSHHRRIINTCLCLIALVLVIGIASLILLQGRADPYKGLILNNVHVAGVDVGGMKPDKAVQALEAGVGNVYSRNDMTVILGKNRVVLSPAQTHAAFQAEKAVQAAFAFGRTGTTSQRQQDAQEARTSGKEISLTPYLGIDTAYIRSALETAIGGIGGEYVPSGYVLDGKKPSLDADGFDESAPCQTLMLTVGHPGSNTDIGTIVDAVLDAYSRGDFEVTIPLSGLAGFPEDLDLDAIHAELTIPPVEAAENQATHEVTSGSCGYTFSLEDAKAKLAQANYGDVIAIPMTYVKPEKLDIYGEFPEVLGTYSTPLGSDSGYNRNMELICKSIDGTVLQPGESFSFNTKCIARTEGNGFVSAPTHDKYCASVNLNAGADQVASTLYVCAINSDLTIVERHNADHACGYTILGTELTVGQTWEDLKFRNTLNQSVKIRARVTDSQLVIRILGQSAPEYRTALEAEQLSTVAFGTVFVFNNSSYQNQEVIFEGLAGGQVQLYRVKYDRTTQQEISRTRECFVDVRAANKLIAQG